jgi:hypothetical protein
MLIIKTIYDMYYQYDLPELGIEKRSSDIAEKALEQVDLYFRAAITTSSNNKSHHICVDTLESSQAKKEYPNQSSNNLVD